MTCTNCEDDTAPLDTYVVYGGLIYCDLDCLAEYYLDNESRFERYDQGAEYVENNYKKIKQ
jgi:hypothetical protein